MEDRKDGEQATRNRIHEVLRNDARQNRIQPGRDAREANERAERQDPAAQRPIIADVERQNDTAVLPLGVLLRRMPSPFTNVRRDARLERDLDVFRRSLVDAERMRERAVGNLRRREALFQQRHLADAID